LLMQATVTVQRGAVCRASCCPWVPLDEQYKAITSAHKLLMDPYLRTRYHLWRSMADGSPANEQYLVRFSCMMWEIGGGAERFHSVQAHSCLGVDLLRARAALERVARCLAPKAHRVGEPSPRASHALPSPRGHSGWGGPARLRDDAC
jgi:hypothetical protein